MARRESSESYTEDEEEEEFVTEGVKVVEWPPQKDMEEDGMTSTVTTSVRYVTVSNNSCAADAAADGQDLNGQQHKTFLSKELFSPGKLDVGSRWQPPAGSSDSGELSGAPKRKLKNLNEVLQNEAVIGKHVTYHVPPGTTRTHRAQESYEKHLNWTVKEVK